MSQSTVSVRMDEALKQEFDTVCNDLGLSMSTAVTMLAKKMAREKRLPFEVALDPFHRPDGGHGLPLTDSPPPIRAAFFCLLRSNQHGMYLIFVVV